MATKTFTCQDLYPNLCAHLAAVLLRKEELVTTSEDRTIEERALWCPNSPNLLGSIYVCWFVMLNTFKRRVRTRGDLAFSSYDRPQLETGLHYRESVKRSSNLEDSNVSFDVCCEYLWRHCDVMFGENLFSRCRKFVVFVQNAVKRKLNTLEIK